MEIFLFYKLSCFLCKTAKRRSQNWKNSDEMKEKSKGRSIMCLQGASMRLKRQSCPQKLPTHHPPPLLWISFSSSFSSLTNIKRHKNAIGQWALKDGRYKSNCSFVHICGLKAPKTSHHTMP
jgi:hypothetical protein